MLQKKVCLMHNKKINMNKKEITESLSKKPTELTKEQLSELFGIFCFSVKEYYLGKRELCFEIHFKRIYLIRVEFPIGTGLMSFRNEFINMSDGCHGISMQQAKNTGELLKVFINMFYDNLLADAEYECYYDEEYSRYSSPKEAQEYLKHVQCII